MQAILVYLLKKKLEGNLKYCRFGASYLESYLEDLPYMFVLLFVITDNYVVVQIFTSFYIL